MSTVIDRFSQIEPSLLFATTGHIYNGKKYSRKKEITRIIDRISSIQETVFIPCQNGERIENGSAIPWSDVLKTKAETLSFTPVEFSHPIWVLYSSGTTGKPKAITHSHGGMLFEHLKYMHFHNDVKPGENFFWYTTTGWMMWNFLQASLLAGATPVLYAGLFLGDENHERYKESYIETFEGKWRHGDWIKLYDNGSLIIQGRSDATLNRKVIRIGTAEIYAILDGINGIKVSLIVNIEQSDADDFIPLFVALEKENVKHIHLFNYMANCHKLDHGPVLNINHFSSFLGDIKS